MQVLVEGIKKANSAKSDDVAKALLGLTLRLRSASRPSAPRTTPRIAGSSGQDDQGPALSVPVMEKPMYVDPTPFID